MSQKGFSVLPTHTTPSGGTPTSGNPGTGRRGADHSAGRITNLAMPSRFSGMCPRGSGCGSGMVSDSPCWDKGKWILLIFVGSTAMVMLFYGLSFVATGKYVPPPTPPPVAPLMSFISLGDWGDNGLYQSAVAKQLEAAVIAYNVSLLVTTGDNFYPAGVETDVDPAWDTIYRNIYNTPRLSSIPWYITLGNHDRYAASRGQAQIDYYLNKRDNRWYLPAAWYTKTLEVNGTKVQFVMYDSSVFIASDVNDTQTQQEQVAQNQWLDNVMVNTNGDWVFTVGHHPVISYHPPAVTGMQKLVPFLKSAKADAYICGHDHDLQHSVGDSVQYFVSGAGAKREARGTATTPTGGRWSQQDVSGFAVHQIWKDVMTTRFIDGEGNVIYTTTQARRAKQ